MKRQVSILLIIILILIVVVFAWLNVQTVTINFGVSQISLPLVVILVGAVLLGALITMIGTFGVIYQLKTTVKKLEQANQVKTKSISKTKVPTEKK